ncbi:MAG: N-acetylmuramoyl-L-alanine amidase [Ruminiclostridium sp.]|nr:N-acetylmuramoyl-L-alanine amidase [Ruminiclostridium sp.]
MKRLFALLLAACLILGGCGTAVPQETPEPETSPTEVTEPDEPEIIPEETQEAVTPEPKVVVIDAGHQARANTDQEPIGPGASETKMKVTGGTSGVATGIPEYELVLTVAQQLRTELEARGYQVVMVRESHDVDMSNRERADIANQSGGDIFLRIHANGSEDQTVTGAMTLCPTPQSPYPIGQLYDQCRLLSDCVLEEFVAATGAKQLYVWETDTMSGINWCQIPVTILEMGFMSSPQEDVLLNTPTYQANMVTGIANGVDTYFARLGT